MCLAAEKLLEKDNHNFESNIIHIAVCEFTGLRLELEFELEFTGLRIFYFYFIFKTLSLFTLLFVFIYIFVECVMEILSLYLSFVVVCLFI